MDNFGNFSRPHPGRHSLRITNANDSFFGPGIRSVKSKDMIPGSTTRTDDDGWTNSTGLEYSYSKGNESLSFSAQAHMLTQRGYWDNPRSDSYQGLRNDVVELQANYDKTVSTSEQSRLTYGGGAGAQLAGDMKLDIVQEWWHREGVGGRTFEEGLQSTYTQNKVSVTPTVQGKVRFEHDLVGYQGGAGITAYSQGKATVAIGQGLSYAEANTGVEVRPTKWSFARGGVQVGAMHNNRESLDFLVPRTSLNSGWHSEVGVDFKNVAVSGSITSNGVKNESNWAINIGVRF